MLPTIDYHHSKALPPLTSKRLMQEKQFVGIMIITIRFNFIIIVFYLAVSVRKILLLVKDAIYSVITLRRYNNYFIERKDCA
jgi:hypothetical protein